MFLCLLHLALERDDVIERHHIAGGGGMTLRVGNDEAHLGAVLVERLWTAYLDVGEGHEPTCGHRTTVELVHDAAGERGRERGIVTGNLHDIRRCGEVGRVVPGLRRIVEDIVFAIAADERGALGGAQLRAATAAHDLHVDTVLVELHEFVLGYVGGHALLLELVFGDDHDGRVGDELRNGVALLLLLVAVGLVVVTTG